MRNLPSNRLPLQRLYFAHSGQERARFTHGMQAKFTKTTTMKNNFTLTPTLRILALITLLSYLSGLGLPAQSNAIEGDGDRSQQ
jgi:hypothetical protein